MKEHKIFTPLLKKIDKVFFGFEDIAEIEKQPELIDSDNDEEYVVERSSN